jgi:hypothetical protein
MLRKIITSVAVTVATIGAAAAMALPASASTGSVPVPVPITGVPGIHHPGIGLHPGLGFRRPGFGLGGCGLGSCGIGIGGCGLSSCLGGCGLGSCGGLGLGDPIFVGGSRWWSFPSSSLCDSGCGELGVTLPETVFVNSDGLCAFSPGGPFINGGRWGLGLRGLGLRSRLF